MKTMLLFIFLILITAVNVNANETVDEPDNDWALKTSLYKTVALDPESILQSGSGLQVSLHRKSLYLYLSKDVNQIRFVGQGGPDINLWSAGVGMQHKLGKHLTVSTDIGWYEPKYAEMGKPQDYMSSPFAEGLGRYLTSKVYDIGGQVFVDDWEFYSLKHYGGIGGKLNLTFEYPITEMLSFNMNAGYRYLKLLENVRGEDYDGGYGRLGEAGCWTIRYERDFSAFMIGGAFVYEF